MKKIKSELKDEKYKGTFARSFPSETKTKEEDEEIAPMKKYQSVVVKKTSQQYVSQNKNDTKITLATKLTLDVPKDTKPRRASFESRLLQSNQWNPPKKSVQLEGIYFDISFYYRRKLTIR